MSNGSYSYPVVETDIVNRPRGRMLKIVVACYQDGGEIDRSSPIMKGPVHLLPDDDARLEEMIENEVERRRSQLRKRHEGDEAAETRALSVAEEVAQKVGEG